MKNFLVIALIFAGFTACQSDTSKQNKADTSPPAKTETSADIKTDTMMHVHTYVCPMHPEVTSQKEGDKCPKCGMNLVHQDSK